MKNPLNKAYTPENKEQADRIMFPDLQSIVDKAEEIRRTEPETRQGFLKGLTQAQAETAEAVERKNAAETEEEYNKACEDESRAKDKEKFFRRMLDKLDSKPRITEEEYAAALKTADTVVREAAAGYLETIRPIMAELVRAQQEYIQTLKDADNALTALDNAGRFLQTKYRLRVTEHSDGTATYTEDPGEWARHIVRYNDDQTRRGLKLIFTKNNRPADLPFYRGQDNGTAVAAWRAATEVLNNGAKDD